MVNFEELKAFYSGKKVLMTGHTGFKGSWLTVILSLLGAKVYGYALKANTDPCLFDILYGSGMSSRSETELHVRLPGSASMPESMTESHIADIRDMDELESYYNRVEPDIVLHLAAQPLVRESYRIPRETYEINVMGTVNVLECVRRHPCCGSFLNVTTDKVYLNEERPDYKYREDDKLDGYDPYANSKSCSELVTHSYADAFLKAAGVAVSTARAGNVIGGGDFSQDRIIPDCVRAAVSHRRIVVRNPHSIRPYQHVFEPLFVYLTIAMRQAQDPSLAGWYNVGPDDADCVTTGQLCDLFTAAYGEGIGWESPEIPSGPHEAGLLKLDNHKIRTVFGWEPVWNIDRAVGAVADWTKAWVRSNEAANEEMLRQIREYTQ